MYESISRSYSQRYPQFRLVINMPVDNFDLRPKSDFSSFRNGAIEE